MKEKGRIANVSYLIHERLLVALRRIWLLTRSEKPRRPLSELAANGQLVTFSKFRGSKLPAILQASETHVSSKNKESMRLSFSSTPVDSHESKLSAFAYYQVQDLEAPRHSQSIWNSGLITE